MGVQIEAQCKWHYLSPIQGHLVLLKKLELINYVYSTSNMV
jgi:hypothetical protein